MAARQTQAPRTDQPKHQAQHQDQNQPQNQNRRPGQAHTHNGNQPTVAGPASQATAKPPSSTVRAPPKFRWQEFLFDFAIRNGNTSFIDKLFVGKFDGARVTTLGTYASFVFGHIDAAALAKLAQICQKGKDLPENSPAREIKFGDQLYVVRPKDPRGPPKEKDKARARVTPDYQMSFVCAIKLTNSRWFNLGQKRIWGYLTQDNYIVLCFSTDSKNWGDAMPDEMERRTLDLVKKLPR